MTCLQPDACQKKSREASLCRKCHYHQLGTCPETRNARSERLKQLHKDEAFRKARLEGLKRREVGQETRRAFSENMRKFQSSQAFRLAAWKGKAEKRLGFSIPDWVMKVELHKEFYGEAKLAGEEQAARYCRRLLQKQGVAHV